jgi:hypothetical protein
MISVTNHLPRNFHIVTGVKDGQPVVEHIKPGETKNLEVPQDHPEIVAHVAAQAITVGSALRGRAASTNSSDAPKAIES